MLPQCRPNTARVDHIHTRQKKGYKSGMENIVDTIYSLKKKGYRKHNQEDKIL